MAREGIGMNPLHIARRYLQGARRVCVLTGAGFSAESGIPTFRGAGGLWRNFKAEDLATESAFKRDPAVVWEWYQWRREIVAAAQPNAGHFALVEIAKSAKNFTLITQNVDGLHQLAGSTDVSELHGSIWQVRCYGCGKRFENRELPLPVLPPKCEECGGLLRPGVVWFDEQLDPRVWRNAIEAVQSADFLLVAGTSAVVYPAALLVPMATAAGARVVEINLEETPVSDSVDVSLRGSSGDVLKALTA